VKGKFYVFLNASAASARLHRDWAHRVNAQPLVTFGVPQSEVQLEALNRMDKWRFAKNALPDNVNLLTLMNDFSGEFDNAAIIRLEHFYEAGEDAVLSQPVTVDLLDFFGDSFEILGITELNLGANMKVADLANRLRFNAQDGLDFGEERTPIRDDFKSFKVVLNPMEIRTFRFWYA
jgi:lysosomal alpha-mannosidase